MADHVSYLAAASKSSEHLEQTMSTSIELTPEIEQRLDALASRTGHSRAYHLREAIEHGLEDMEDYYRACVVMDRVRRGEEELHSAAEMRKELGLDNFSTAPLAMRAFHAERLRNTLRQNAEEAVAKGLTDDMLERLLNDED